MALLDGLLRLLFLVRVLIFLNYFFICTLLFSIVGFLLWAYLPENILDEYGITYYPSRYWALALPAMLCVTVMMTTVIYVAINMLSTAPLDSYNTIRGWLKLYDISFAWINIDFCAR